MENGGAKVKLCGHEDLFTFYNLNSAMKKYIVVPETFDHYVDHLPGLANFQNPNTQLEGNMVLSHFQIQNKSNEHFN